MALIVQKFGGTSVGTIARIKNAASRSLATQKDGHRVVVIVSAMSGETDRLLRLAKDVTPIPNAREMDALAATGEQVSSALMAIAIQSLGGKARSFVGHQMKILTDSAFTKARIKTIDAGRVFGERRRGRDRRRRRLPRRRRRREHHDARPRRQRHERGCRRRRAQGGQPSGEKVVCEIYTDVDGVYTTDPNVCPTARKIERISYEEMLELASLGAKVLQIRSVEMAMKYGVPVHVRSSFSSVTGTMVTGEGALEGVMVTGVAYDKGEARVMLVGVLDRPGVVAQVFGDLARENVSVDMIIQNLPSERLREGGGGQPDPLRTDVTFTVAKTDLVRVRAVIDSIAKQVGALDVRYDEDIVKVSIVGLGMRSHAGVAAKMFRILADEGINIQAISTSEIKVSCLVATKYTELAVRSLHDGFGLAHGAREEHGGL